MFRGAFFYSRIQYEYSEAFYCRQTEKKKKKLSLVTKQQTISSRRLPANNPNPILVLNSKWNK